MTVDITRRPSAAGRAARLWSGAALLAMTAATLPRPSAAEPPSRHDDWSAACAEQRGCALEQRILDGQGRQIMALRVVKQADRAFLEIVTPLGSYIPAGIQFQVDEETAYSATMVDCLPRGCRSVSALDRPLAEAMRKGAAIAVRFVDSASGKTLSVRGSLKGFTAASNRIDLLAALPEPPKPATPASEATE